MDTGREGGLLAWQFRDYAERHQDKLNLWLHLYSVPIFIAGTVAGLFNLVTQNLLGFAASLAFVAVALLLQWLGHRRELLRPSAANDLADAVVCTFAEQFITFPRFVLSGGWMRGVTRRDRRH